MTSAILITHKARFWEGFRWGVLLFASLALLAFMSACTSMTIGSSAPEPLEKAAKTVAKMMAPASMRKSAFYVAYPQGKPSDYVSYQFSTIGAIERPPVEGVEFSKEELEGMHNSIPVWPEGVMMYPNAPKKDYDGYQIVLSADDTKGVVVVKGYLPTKGKTTVTEPVLTREIKLVATTPEPMVQQFYQSNIEMGASPEMSQTDYPQ